LRHRYILAGHDHVLQDRYDELVIMAAEALDDATRPVNLLGPSMIVNMSALRNWTTPPDWVYHDDEIIKSLVAQWPELAAVVPAAI
jgi:hypothetical protein